MYEEFLLQNNQLSHHFELQVEGEIAFIDYQQKGNKVFLIHTEVPAELEGKGVATALVTKTFVYLEENKLKMIVLCPYIKVFLKRHPEWERLVA